MKKNKNELHQGVDLDAWEIVNDFARRTTNQGGFENYRPLPYKTPSLKVLEKISSDNLDILSELFQSGSLDAANSDCLLDNIIYSLKQSLTDLKRQRLQHRDFYHRYAILRKTDCKDYQVLLNQEESVLEQLKKQYDFYKELWDTYHGFR